MTTNATAVPYLVVPATEKFLFGRHSAAEALDLSVRQIDYLIETGKLETQREGKRVLIPRDSLLAYVGRR
jgi:excisionase family DNA binding protein